MAQRPVQWGFRNCSARAEMIYPRKSGSAHERWDTVVFSGDALPNLQRTVHL